MKIGVFCSSSDRVHFNYAKEIGFLSQELVKRKFEIVYGGSNEGLMKHLADSALEAGGKVTGIVPKYFVGKKKLAHDGLSKLIVVDSLMERKQKFVELSHFLVGFPGGIGTLDEMVDVMSRKQLFEKPFRPLYLLNFLNFWSPFIQFLENLKKNQFIRVKNLGDLFKVVSTSKELFLELEKQRDSMRIAL